MRPVNREQMVPLRSNPYFEMAKTIADINISKTWSGVPLPDCWHISLQVFSVPEGLLIRFDAPFFPNPPPPSAPGPTAGLWEYDVVEFFFLGDNNCYFEVEMGPYGHYLALMLEGRRKVKKSLLPLDFAAAVAENRWTGRVTIPSIYLPKGLSRWNAYGIFSVDGRRQYSALFALGGDAPDFHRLEDFSIIE